MNNYCGKCGAKLQEGAKVCGQCGSPVDGEPINYNSTSNAPTVKNRSIGLAIVLCLVTCGFYLFIWMPSITDDVKMTSDDPNDTSGAMVVLLSLITCGIYTIYWYYKMGNKLYEAGKRYNKNISDNSIVYLILGIFGLGIINYCILQSDLNKFS